MRTRFFITLLLVCTLSVFAQQDQNLDFAAELRKTEELTTDQNRKVDAAMAVLSTVHKSGNYIRSLEELFSAGVLPLPAGIKSEQGGYEFVIQRILKDDKTGKKKIYASCAFRFKDTGQPIAFEGEVVLEGKNGAGTRGKLALIAPFKRNIGKQSALIIREGTSLSFGCKGIESFDAHLAWLITSDKILPVNAQGKAVPDQKLGVAFNAHFEDFDNYLVSLNIDKSFIFKGLDDIIFSLKGAVIDQSDTENDGMMRYPGAYFDSVDPKTQKLWKGVSISSASVSLPPFFKQANSSDRIVLALNNALFDENGFSGSISAENIIPSSTLDREAWQASLTGLSIGILKNNIASFSLIGDVNIPPFGKNSLLPYIATFNTLKEEYEFRVKLAGDYDFPALRSTLTLNELSSIRIQYKDNGLYPRIDATGKLAVNAPADSKDSAKTLFSVPDISFENLIISREAPYFQIGRIGVGGTIRSPNIAGFEMSISDIRNFKGSEGEGLVFSGAVGLANGSFALAGQTEVKLLGDYKTWKFNKVQVEKVHVAYESKAFALSGGVWLKNGDELYGDGFRGDIRLKLINKFSFDAVGIFGKKDDFRYFLTDVFFETNPANGVPIPPVLSFYGFGGGLYQRMQQAGKSSSAIVGKGNTDALNFGQSLSGIRYVPDRQVGMGLTASSQFALIASEKAFNARVGFEMQFNNRGGLNFVQLRGEGAFMDSPGQWGTLNDNLQADYNNGKNQPEKAQKSDMENKIPQSAGMLSASLLFEYDNINDRFNADLSTYLNVKDIIKGTGPNDRLGWAKAYLAPDQWYFFLGSPADPLGINVLDLAKLTGYFMLGKGLPALPAPPEKVLKNLSPEKQAKLKTRENDKLGNGKGIALGAAFTTSFDASFLIFYAKMHLGLGAEFLLTDLKGQTCAGINGVPGINGWYAQAQAWAYVEADIGLQAKIMGSRRRFSILDLSIGALLEGKGPNPFYFAGAVGGQYRILGGLIKGNCNFEFELGEECKLTGGSPFEENVIAQLTPASGDREVNVFVSPQAIFNVPVGETLNITEDDGRKSTYKVHLEEFTVKYKGSAEAVKGQRKANREATVYAFVPDEPFESRKEVEISAKLTFLRKEGNNWVEVKENGKTYYETRSARFETGDRPKEILPEHVAYSYPMLRQYNFYPGEHKQAYLLLSQNYSYLFTADKPEGFDQKLRISTADGRKTEKSFAYTTISSVSGVKMEITCPLEDLALQNEKIYKLAIVNIPVNANVSMTDNVSETTTQLAGMEDGTAETTRRQAAGSITSLSEKEIYAITFKSSRYNTFAEKMRTFEKPGEGWRDVIYPYIHNINTNLREPELFDAYETGSSVGHTPLVRLEAQLDQTAWYNETPYRSMYLSHSELLAPKDKITIWQNSIQSKLLTDNEISLNAASGYPSAGLMSYELAGYCARDLTVIKNDVARKVAQGQSIPASDAALLQLDYPPVVFRGNYPIAASYILPGRNTVSSTVHINMYNPIHP